ncbi:hypothetical protein Lesp02_53760 [Lentzea sp. NBRC 105346]|uniref:hypothetical protein n=1 Tax=Lentzea sp. NBRC 105346 TaxID=3032205 RepID=UPI0024A11548|nr:hypothetical protein [Lentzea sp. NBRC 105346]GLZ33188.1 hypothetical protein Lesp02_53760 [Lentzea sp. NBRC 105346]
MGTWRPKDEAELAAGWSLWLELSTRVWPDPSWDGTPADAIRQVRDLLSACEQIRSSYEAEAAAPSVALLQLLQSMTFVASFPVDLWHDDTHPLDVERAALLHGDLASFAEHVAGVRAALARGGGWASLDAERRPWGLPVD